MVAEPAVSVVIPSHNRARHVGRAIESVLGQRHIPVDVIVVDDGSTDGTPQILQTYDGAIRSFRTTGIERGAARNLGATHARAPLLCFLDSDDFWAEDKLLVQLEATAPGGVSVTGLRFVDDAGDPTGGIYLPPRRAQQRLLLENLFLGSPSSILVPKTVFREVGGFPEERELQGAEDRLFLIKLHRHGCVIDRVTQPLVSYRLHGSNSTGSPEFVARCMWSSVTWIEESGPVTDGTSRRLRARTASVIARGFAAHRRWRDAAAWVREALKSGSPSEAALGVSKVVLSAGASVVRRRL